MKGLVLEIIGNDYIILFERALDHLFVRNPHFHPPHTRTKKKHMIVLVWERGQHTRQRVNPNMRASRKKERRTEERKT